MKSVCTLMVGLASLAAFAGWRPPLERYESIIERMPFGSDSGESGSVGVSSSEENVSAAMTFARQSAEEQKLASGVRVSILNVTPNGDVKVGFTDSSARPSSSYYLKVGSSRDGWTVKSADPAAERVVLERGGVQVMLKLGVAANGRNLANGTAPKVTWMVKRKKRG